MLRSVAIILVIAFAALATNAHPDQSDSDTPDTERNFPDRPEKHDPPSFASNSYSPPESVESLAALTGIPRQEIPEDGALELQTTDACDSADMVRFAIPLPEEGKK